ncbi:MAG: amidophosphoribosyltransferase, partial [Lachnospiraceae bacterium]|nr:amidophosphoribosyltransferase [Lachnospiraceae bacterium]
MGGFFAAASREACIFDLFFGTDYHSHLGTRRAGMVTYDPEEGFNRAIHNIENSPFRTKFDKEFNEMKGNIGIGCISDYDPQPLLVRSRHGSYAILTVGKINNINELTEEILNEGSTHFFVQSHEVINTSELTAALIDHKDNFVEGIQYAQERIDGSLTILILTPKGIYCARDKMGRTPVVLGQKDT